MEHSRGCPEFEDSSDEPPPNDGDGSASPAATVATAAATRDGRRPNWAPHDEWNDWRWQMRNRIRTLQQLGQRFSSLPLSQGMAAATARFPLAITPYYASLIRALDGSDPIFQMCVPQRQELFDPPCLGDDPLGEEEDMPVPGLVHRYPDRALLIATTTCGVYCRHCTRKRMAGQRETCISAIRLGQVTEYLSVHPEVKDVVISGGDPLTLATGALEKVLAAVRSVPTVEIVRVGTRAPVVMPMRITGELLKMLRRYHPLFVNTHFNHPAELTPEAQEACLRLADAGVPVGNQSVLLRGVNDDARLLADLFRKLLRVRVRPYYLFQCDLVRGVEHFRTPLARGVEIMEHLRGRLSGLAIPAFVVDAPHGGGKIPVLPNYVISASPSHTVLRNYEGALVSYPEPGDLSLPLGEAAVGSAAQGVWELAAGHQTRMQPRHRVRHTRRKARTLAMQLDMRF